MKDYQIENIDKGRGIKVTFEQSIQAETTRALLLLAGKTREQIHLTGPKDAQAKTLEIDGMNAKDFKVYYEITHNLGDELRHYAEAMGVEVGLPMLHFNQPAINIVRSSFAGKKEARPHYMLAAQLEKAGIKADVDEREQFITFTPSPGVDLTKNLEAMIDAPRKRINSGKQEGRGRG